MNYLKNSFIFLETIVSLLIISLIVAIFFKISYNKSNDKTFTKILTVSNELKKSNCNICRTYTKTLVVKKDGIEENLLVKTISYEDSSIKLFKYELQ